MSEAFPAPQRENVPQPLTNGRFEYHEDRHGELCQRIMSRGKRNAKGNWDAKGICHSGKGGKGLVYFPSSAAVKCNAEPACDYFSILRAEGLSDVQLPSRDSNHKSEAAEHASANADDGVIARLAMLAPLDYDRVRESEAKALGCRTSILDKLVDAERPKQQRDLLQGTPLALSEVELWPDAVAGAAVLDEISKVVSRYVALPPGAADVIALWCAHAHVYDAFDCSPRLNFSSPEKGCGKTVARDVTALFVPRPLATENLSVPVLFRIVESHKPTLLADECDAYLGNNEELRGVLNAGHRRGGQALRCEGENNEVRAFHVFGPAVLCGIGALPGTLADRSIRIRLERAKRGEVARRLDSRRPWPEAHRQKTITQTWLAHHLRDFRILSKSIRIEKDSEKNNAKGYELKDFRDAFDRYLSDQGFSSRHKENACDVSKTHEVCINTSLCRCAVFITPKGSLESEEDVIRAEREAIEQEGSQRWA